MCLVGVAKVGRELGPVDQLTAVRPGRGLVQPGPAHHPLRADADVVGEQPLPAARGHPGRVGQPADAPQRRISGDARHYLGGLLSRRVPLRPHRTQHRLGMPRHLRIRIRIRIRIRTRIRIGIRLHDRLPGLLRPRPEEPRGRNDPVGQLRDGRLPERPEATGQEPHSEHPARTR
ncbi:MAG TPA: hypothetical protein VHO07_19705 [Streptosporangiaceae bacterium]|nr:hypothetical protein [Streptosporangiaceae bacterium]